jgi:hypothetical protein
MSADLAELIDRIQAGGRLEALSIQREMSALWDQLDNEDDRVSLLKVHRAFMDWVERTGGLEAEALARFQSVRNAEYQLFLVKEARAGTETADPVALDRITRREVEAGRLASDSDFRQFASDAGAVFGQPTARRKTGLFRKLFG